MRFSRLDVDARFAPLFYILEEFEGMLIIVSAEGNIVNVLRVDAAPGALYNPGADEILHEFRHIVAVAFLPVIGEPEVRIRFHTTNNHCGYFRPRFLLSCKGTLFL